MCANHLPGQSVSTSRLRRVWKLTIVSVMNGTGVHDLGSNRGGTEENALILDRTAF
jgi:hypothetical protein